MKHGSTRRNSQSQRHCLGMTVLGGSILFACTAPPAPWPVDHPYLRVVSSARPEVIVDDGDHNVHGNAMTRDVSPLPAMLFSGGLVNRALSRDGTLSAQRVDGGIQVFRVSAKSRKPVCRLSHPHGEAEEVLTFAPNGSFLVSNNDHAATLWHLKSTKKQFWIAAPHLVEDRLWSGGDISGIAITNDSKSIIFGADTGTEIWDVASGKQVRTLDHPGFNMWLSEFYLSSDGAVFAVFDGSPKQLHLWDTRTWMKLSDRHLANARSTAVNNGRVLSTTITHLYIWDLKSGKQLDCLPLPGIPERGITCRNHRAWIRVSSDSGVRTLLEFEYR